MNFILKDVNIMKVKNRSYFRAAAYLAYLVCAVLVIVLIHIISAYTWDRKIHHREISYTNEKLPPAMDGYRIAFITDTHILEDKDLWAVVEEINQREVDLFLLGGDFNWGDYGKRQIEILRYVNATDGIYGVEGNHDYYVNTFSAMEDNGIVPLSNTGVKIQEGFFLAGLDDLWNRSPDISAAIQDAAENDFILLLSHNPDVIMQQNGSAVSLMLSGHTHGGQITFFGIYAPALLNSKTITSYGQKFKSGWANGKGGTDVYVSRGTGQTHIPRVFAPPEVTYITLHGK